MSGGVKLGCQRKAQMDSTDGPHRWYLAAHSKPKCATVQMGLGLPELAVDRQGIVKGPIRQTMGAVTDHRLTDTAVGSELPRGHREAVPHRDSVALASRWTLVSSRSARQEQCDQTHQNILPFFGMMDKTVT